MNRPLCGSCPECIEAARRLLDDPGRRQRTGRPITAAGLERHAQRFGPEAVAETATELGLEVEVEDTAPRRRRRRRK